MSREQELKHSLLYIHGILSGLRQCDHQKYQPVIDLLIQYMERCREELEELRVIH